MSWTHGVRRSLQMGYIIEGRGQISTGEGIGKLKGDSRVKTNMRRGVLLRKDPNKNRKSGAR